MIEIHGVNGVNVVRLARGKVNALDLELLRELTRELGSLARPGQGLVITGTGRSFSAGVDLRRLVEGGGAYAQEFMPALSAAFMAVFDHPGPVVAAINGHAIAGGYVIAAACDHRVAAEGDGRIGLTELRVGVPFPTSAIEIVRHALGTPTAARLALHADLVSVHKALALGLVDEVVPGEELVETAAARAATLADRDPTAYEITKRQLQAPARQRIDERGPAEDRVVNEVWSQADARKRIEVFLDGISPG